MTSIFCTNAEVIEESGLNANSTITASGAWLDSQIAKAESFINVVTNYNWSDAYSGLNVDVKKVLSETAAVHAAIKVIKYDPSGYTSRAEAEFLTDVLADILIRNVAILKEAKARDFVLGA